MLAADVLKHPDPRDWEHGVRPKYRVSLWRSVVSWHRFDWRCGWRSRSVGYVCCCSFSDVTKGKHYTKLKQFYLSLIFINIKGTVYSKICWECTPRDIQDVDELVSSSEQIWRNVAYFTCSSVDALQWMGAVRIRVQTADKNITLIHTTPVYQWMSGEGKSYMIVRNKFIIKTFLTSNCCLRIESSIISISFSGEKIIPSESEEKYAQIKHRLPAKTVLN